MKASRRQRFLNRKRPLLDPKLRSSASRPPPCGCARQNPDEFCRVTNTIVLVQDESRRRPASVTMPSSIIQASPGRLPPPPVLQVPAPAAHALDFAAAPADIRHSDHGNT